MSSKFVSRQRDFRIFLKLEDSGGRWADFGRAGEYEAKNKEDAEKLRSASNFKKDFFEVGIEPEKPKELRKCPFCEYTGAVNQVRMHALAGHKKQLTVEDMEKVA